MAPDMEPAWFRSKVDAWLGAILAVAPVGGTVAVVAEGLAGDSEGFWVGAGGMALFGAIYGLLVFPMRYGISHDQLIVRHGIVRQRVPLARIREVKPSRNPISSPALSLDRLEIRYGVGFFGWVLISPADRDGFLGLLAERAGLMRHGETLTRAETRVDA